MSQWGDILQDSTVFGLIAALFGGAGVRVLDRILSKKSDTFNEAERIRAELRQSLEHTQTEVRHLQDQLDMWHTRYWDEVEAHMTTKRCGPSTTIEGVPLLSGSR